MIKKKYYLTKEGLEKLKKEYERLKELRLQKIKGERPQILHSDDLNPEYFIFQQDFDQLELRLAEVKEVLENSELIVPPPKEEQNKVYLGATVTLEEEDGQINEFMIVSSLEANPSEGKISSESPVGKALLGKKIGDKVLITSPIKVIYKIKKIKYELS
jgi:transcription elongation GreA/GreB family factor